MIDTRSKSGYNVARKKCFDPVGTSSHVASQPWCQAKVVLAR